MTTSTQHNMEDAIWHWMFWKRVVIHFIKRKGTDAAGILAYTSLLGIVPMLAVMLSLFSVSSYFADFESLVMEQVVHNLMPSSQPVIESYLVTFSQQAVNLKGPGLIVMFITTIMLLWKVDDKLNGLWPNARRRRWWVSLLHYLGISLLGPILLGLSLLTSSYLLAVPLLEETYPLLQKLTFGISLLPFVFAFLGFTALYKFVPHYPVSTKAAMIGGLLATLQLELLKEGFALYVQWFPSYNLIYGAFAAVPLFLLWLYLMWVIVIWNGAVVAVLNQRYHPARLLKKTPEQTE
ncbi:YihY family inner membrane protein [Thiomicrorhabdus chilensis]|uniref:YihY family inner membrane protein n=1 Tax=Thiomicrorhabdus chilensis TaxID=63656 RepID=UPI0009FCEB57|nr:YihY family inner membrane protein [Thiomicrorhabdus chilensis]